ncbi:hypothetical protein ACHAWF_007590 [Thalassiosira exigua]
MVIRMLGSVHIIIFSVTLPTFIGCVDVNSTIHGWNVDENNRVRRDGLGERHVNSEDNGLNFGVKRGSLTASNDDKKYQVQWGSLRGSSDSSDTCITSKACKVRSQEMGMVEFRQGNFQTKGCFAKNGRAYFGLGGTRESMTIDALPGIRKRIWCRTIVRPTRDNEMIPPANSEYTIGVYYYPWHGNDFHRGSPYLRRELQPPQRPALGEYDDSDPKVIRQHLKWSRQSNINLWVASWWGPDSQADSTIKNVIMPHSDLNGTRIALFYETHGRVRKNGNYDNIANAYWDAGYIANTYFDDPNYLRIEGRPVLFVYVTRLLSKEGKLGEVVRLMRLGAMDNGGHDLYIVGDQVFHDAPSSPKTYEPFDLLDGVTNYDVYGNMRRPNGYAGLERLEDMVKRNQEWRHGTRTHANCAFIPSVSPGYNDRAVRFHAGHAALSRKLYETDKEGSLFQYSLEKSLPLTDGSTGRMLMINSWNEWHEDTQIEPVQEVSLGQPVADRPMNFTCYGDACDDALTYEAYGELYLNILREITSPAPSPAGRLKPLKKVGNDGEPRSAYPLDECEGDCDDDSECQGSLVCFQRSSGEEVPGCTGDGSSKKTDYCIQSKIKELKKVGNDGQPRNAYPLGECEGDCDDDWECQGHLVCFQRGSGVAVPGCSGSDTSKTDYCVHPLW